MNQRRSNPPFGGEEETSVKSGFPIKEVLLKEFNLHTVVRLPNGVFAPYTTIRTNILFFDRTGPTKEIWFYEQPLPEGRKNYTKTKPMQFEEFDDCLTWWYNREENDRVWRVSEVLRGRIDVLILQGQLWALVVESKKTTIPTRSALPQALAYLLVSPQSERPLFGLLINGDDVLFVKLTQQPERLYGLSRVFSLYTLASEWHEVLRILKKLASLALRE